MSAPRVVHAARTFRLTINLFAAFCIGAAPALAAEIKKKTSLPAWWNTPQYKNTDVDLNDTQQAGGGMGSDGLPDGAWTTSGGAANTPPGVSETTIPKGGELCQVIDNELDDKKYKEYAFTFKYKTANFESGDTFVVTVTPQTDGGGAVASPAADSHEFKGSQANYTTGTLYTRFESQPPKEKVCIRNNASDAGEDVIVDSFDFRTTCVVPESTTLSCPTPSGGDGGSDVLVSYDPPSQTLTFSLATIDFLNANGTREDDGTFPGDPALGSTIVVGEFLLDEITPDAIRFKDGLVTVQNGPTIHFQGIIPFLWLDDAAAGPFGANFFGSVVDPVFTTEQGSLWLDQFAEEFETSCSWPMLFLSTALPIEQPIRDGLAAGSPAELQLGSGGTCGPCGSLGGDVPAASTWGMLALAIAILALASAIAVRQGQARRKAA